MGYQGLFVVPFAHADNSDVNHDWPTCHASGDGFESLMVFFTFFSGGQTVAFAQKPEGENFFRRFLILIQRRFTWLGGWRDSLTQQPRSRWLDRWILNEEKAWRDVIEFIRVGFCGGCCVRLLSRSLLFHSISILFFYCSVSLLFKIFFLIADRCFECSTQPTLRNKRFSMSEIEEDESESNFEKLTKSVYPSITKLFFKFQ